MFFEWREIILNNKKKTEPLLSQHLYIGSSGGGGSGMPICAGITKDYSKMKENMNNEQIRLMDAFHRKLREKKYFTAIKDEERCGNKIPFEDWFILIPCISSFVIIVWLCYASIGPSSTFIAHHISQRHWSFMWCEAIR